MKHNEKVNLEDRRVQRTRQILHEALLALIIEKGYDEITVQDLIDRANVGRSTFYAHFYDKEDLLLSGLEKLRESFQLRLQQRLSGTANLKERTRELSLMLFQHTGNHRQLYKALVGKRGSDQVFKKIHGFFTSLIEEELKSRLPDSSVEELPSEVVICFLASSLQGLVTWWLHHDSPYTPEQMSEMYYRLALRSLP